MKPNQVNRILPTILTFALAAFAVAGLTGCKKESGGAESASVIKVGEFASLTGKEAAWGRSSDNGTQLAVDEINAGGGVLGKKLQLIAEDDQSKESEAATVVHKLISRDNVVAVLGEVASGRSLAAGPICEDSKVPMISPSSTNPKVTATGNYIFRVCFTDPFQGKLLADFGRKTLKANKVAVLSDVGAAYSVGLAQYFREAFLASGGTIVADQKYNSGDKDFKAQLTAIKAANPDAIFVPGYYTEVGLIVLQARQLGIELPMFGGDGWEAQELIQIAGAGALRNTFYSTHFSAIKETPEVQKFVKAYQAKFKGEIPDAMAALGYDSVLILVDAIKRAGTTDGPKVRDALATTDVVGATGRTKLDAQRNPAKAAVIITVEKDHFKFVQDVEP
jgi:branched-chain amino acid transport system substrate-binding protein